jgi:hypothetical protein
MLNGPFSCLPRRRLRVGSDPMLTNEDVKALNLSRGKPSSTNRGRFASNVPGLDRLGQDFPENNIFKEL